MLFGLFGNTDYKEEAEKLLTIVNDSIKTLNSLIINSNNKTKNFKTLSSTFNKVNSNLKSVKNKIDKLQNQFKNTINKKNPDINKTIPVSGQAYITRNGSKYKVTKVPTIKQMQQILMNFKKLSNNRSFAQKSINQQVKNAQNAQKKIISNEQKVANLEKKTQYKKELENSKLVEENRQRAILKAGATKLRNSFQTAQNSLTNQRRLNINNTVRNALGTKPPPLL